MPELCDGLDNDCDGQVDDEGVADECELAQVGEVGPLDASELIALVAVEEEFALFTTPSSSSDADLALRLIGSDGELIGDHVEIVFLPEVARGRSNSTQMLWNGSEYLFFTPLRIDSFGGYTDPSNPGRVAFEIWVTKISPNGGSVATAIFSPKARPSIVSFELTLVLILEPSLARNRLIAGQPLVSRYSGKELPSIPVRSAHIRAAQTDAAELGISCSGTWAVSRHVWCFYVLSAIGQFGARSDAVG